MGDFALEFDLDAGADLAVEDDDLLSEEGLRTAAFLSLFTDRRAEEDDELPSEDGDRRGWWGDEFAEVEGDLHGSRLWLLARTKITPDLLPLVEEYDREALAWMLEDRVTDRIDVVPELDRGVLYHAITIHRPRGRDPVTFRFAHVWDAEAARAGS